MKVTDLKTSSYPNGMPKNITVFVSVRKDGAEYPTPWVTTIPFFYSMGCWKFLCVITDGLHPALC